MFEWFSVLVGEFGKEVALVTAVVYGGYKFRRIQSILGGVVGAIGTAATFGALTVGALVLGMATGWISVDAGQMLGDIVSGAGTAWDIIGQDAVEWLTTEVL
ncbi:hypothetical protein AMS69_10230 [Haloarcula rubripromontorii]|uniref:Uncharacterized protein n=1 Tax=Haloarcula rubripromontorii TaxID=1705562 RepID=A0A0N0U9H8_9EURY|nr:hypothetical protein [Haloarcula rubripromontorii]KOX92826.1 hypothetical protein AMS69_10230 [Haloarcula rubripromontorii]